MKKRLISLLLCLAMVIGFISVTALAEVNDDNFIVTKTVANDPANGDYFVKGETIKFEITIYNESGETLKNVKVYDILKETNDGLVGTIAELGAEPKTITYNYKVTADDVEEGEVDNIAWAEVGDDMFVSNELIVFTSSNKRYIDIEKVVLNEPANGEFFVEGEKIQFKLTLTNLSDTKFTDVDIYDILVDYELDFEDEDDLPEDLDDIFLIKHLNELGSKPVSFTYEYKVKAEDIEEGEVYNVAWAISEDRLFFSNEVEVEVGVDEETPDDGGNSEIDEPDDGGNSEIDEPDDGGSSEIDEPDDGGNSEIDKPDDSGSSEVDKPDDGTSETEKQDDNKPNTGDNSNIVLWIVLLAVSAVAAVAVVAFSKKRSYNK